MAKARAVFRLNSVMSCGGGPQDSGRFVVVTAYSTRVQAELLGDLFNEGNGSLPQLLGLHMAAPSYLASPVPKDFLLLALDVQVAKSVPKVESAEQ